MVPQPFVVLLIHLGLVLTYLPCLVAPLTNNRHYRNKSKISSMSG